MNIFLAVNMLAAIFTFRADTVREAELRYGKLYRDYSWEHKDRYLVILDLGKLNENLSAVRLNRDIAIPFVITMIELRTEGLLNEITSYQGCYNDRQIRETNRPSTHAFGLGCDFNGGPFTEEFVEVWERNGWCWGGRFSKPDPMHFSYGWECPAKRNAKDVAEASRALLLPD